MGGNNNVFPVAHFLFVGHCEFFRELAVSTGGLKNFPFKDALSGGTHGIVIRLVAGDLSSILGASLGRKKYKYVKDVKFIKL